MIHHAMNYDVWILTRKGSNKAKVSQREKSAIKMVGNEDIETERSIGADCNIV